MTVQHKLAVLSAKLYWPRDAFTLAVEVEFAVGVTVLFGPSGSGKTTLLRCLAGLEKAPQGDIGFGDAVWQSPTTWLAAHSRRIGYVFQEASLFPHLTVAGNLDYARRRAPSHQPHEQTPIPDDELFNLLGITPLLPKQAASLSGGEAQRVAIARALLARPQVLLMDEPLAALDVARKQDLLPFIQALCRRLSLPIIYVTHSLTEVTRLAEQLIVLDEGKVVAAGPLADVLTTWPVAKQLRRDACVVLEGKVVAKEAEWHLMTVALTMASHLPAPELTLTDQAPLGEKVRLRIAASDVSLTLTPPTQTSIINVLAGWVVAVEDDTSPSHCLVKVALQDPNTELLPPMILARLTRKSAALLAIKTGLRLFVQIKSAAMSA